MMADGSEEALLRKYGPIVFVLLLVFGMLWWRFR